MGEGNDLIEQWFFTRRLKQLLKRGLLRSLIRQVDIAAIPGSSDRDVEKSLFLRADFFALPIPMSLGAAFLPRKSKVRDFSGSS